MHDEKTLRALIAEQSTDDDESTMVVESYMVGASPPPSGLFSDYVSVESVVAAGEISHLAVTGRLPQDEPFRETGLIIPSDFDPALQEEILALATAAIRAIGVRIGCLHTEIKVTTKGPRVIEVNGRIGGFVPQTLKLASPTTDLFEISCRVALGEKVVFDGLVPTTGVGYVIAQQPPIGALRVSTVDGLDRWRSTRASMPSLSAANRGTRWTGARGATSTSSPSSATSRSTRTWRSWSSSSPTRSPSPTSGNPTEDGSGGLTFPDAGVRDRVPDR